MLGMIYLELLRGKRVLGQSDREKEIMFNPGTVQEGPNDEIIKDHLDKLVIKGKKNGLVLIL